jgi:hypothetical protein
MVKIKEMVSWYQGSVDLPTDSGYGGRLQATVGDGWGWKGWVRKTSEKR